MENTYGMVYMNINIYIMMSLMFLSTDCHTKVHKEHYDKNEEFLAYCKGKQ